ncbi:C-C motif chemokine 14-like [Moschus berezovskii]|uniref:C-C motif chemokine 14-like n=1 Tax=Moschus berezovskii TaxID=68408 RepID=UPI0024442F3C|nr:C-C motif chemokine 14-like [Moschus berezovskii]
MGEKEGSRGSQHPSSLTSTLISALLPSFSSGGPHHPAECCLTYVSRAVPRQRVSSYYETSSQCAKPGIVFITKKGRYIRANPRGGWVRDYIKELEE